jgi:hypothetical protein
LIAERSALFRQALNLDWPGARIFVAEARQMASYVCMKMLFSMLVALLFVGPAFAATTNTPASLKNETSVPMKIGASDATNYYDQTMVVTGRVVQVTIRPSVTFLNLDKPFPNSPFAIVIIHGKSSYYGDANALKGKSIEISGKIRNYKDKPEIVLSSTNQLTVLNFTNSVKTLAAPAMSLPPQIPSTGSATNDFPEIM